MKQLKKTILTLVALLAVTTGAWAIDPNAVTAAEINSALYSGWSSIDGVLIKASELPGFQTVTEDQAKSWTGAPSTGTVELFYEFVADGQVKAVRFVNGVYDSSFMEEDLERNLIWEDIKYNDAKYFYTTGPAPTGPKVAWTAASKTGTFKMPGGNVTLQPEYYPQAALTAAPTAINDVPATTDGAIVKAGTVATIGSTETAQGTVMYYVSQTALDDAALLALAADQWTADVPTAAKLTKGQAYVYYYVRGNDSDTDEENFSDGDILSANALTVTLGAAPLWNAEFDLTDAPEEDKTGKWSTNIPEGGVVKGTPVTVTYTGTKKIIGVKAEKKSAFTPLDNTITAWTAGSYAVPAGGLTYSDAITVSGDVTLVLTDDETLTLNKGISLAEGATLTVEGNGTMNVNGTNDNTSSTVAGTGMLVLTSGTLNAKGGNGQSITAFGRPTVDNNTGASGGVAINGNVTVSGGTVTATGGNGGNLNSWAPDGGTSNNHGGNGGAAISGSVTVNAGGWTATNGSNGTYTANDEDYNCSAGTGSKAVAGNVTDNR